MKTVSFPYGHGQIEYSFGDELVGVLCPHAGSGDLREPEEKIIARAMAHPIESPTLSELARGKKNIVIIASDHTRPVPSRLIIPPMLDEIKSSAPDAGITILVATGCHRGTTAEELRAKFGDDVMERVRIAVHDCDDRDNLADIGTLPSGGECEIDRIALEADLLVAEGFIEPHFFAGYSGGRKSVLPGIAGRRTVLANHCSEFIADRRARTGVLDGNPIHRDMIWAARHAGLSYIVNVVLDGNKRVIHAVAGDFEAAHRAGTQFIAGRSAVRAVPADIVVTTNGGYPLDQNAYQAVKGMTAAELCVRQGGVIVMLAECSDGVGGDHFYRQLAEERDISRTMAAFLARPRNETVPDQWQTQIMLRILRKARVIFVSSLSPETVEAMHMIPAPSLDEAMQIARRLVGRQNASVTAIPDGVSVIVEE